MALSFVNRRVFAACLATPLLAGPDAIYGARAPVSGSPGFRIDRREKKRVRAILSHQVKCPNIQATDWSVVAAIAPSFAGQEKTRTQMTPQAVDKRDKSTQGRELLIAVLPAKGPWINTLSVVLTYEATLFSRVLKPLEPDEKPPTVAPLRPAEQRNYLASRGDIDFAALEFAAWLSGQRLRRNQGEVDLDFARRIYLRLKMEMRYDYQPLSSRQATFVCKTGKTDCGGLSILFVAVMRAAGIPARVHYGRWAVSAVPDSKLGKTPYFQWHVKCEFFAAGVGWVPVDLSRAVENDTKNPAGLAYFGNDPGTFLTFHFDPNLLIDSGLYGIKAVHNLQYPNWWWIGKGTTEPLIVTENWQVAEIPSLGS